MALPPFRTEMRNSGIPADEYQQEAFPTHSSPGPRIVVRGDGEITSGCVVCDRRGATGR